MLYDNDKIEFYEEMKEKFKDEIIEEFICSFNEWYVHDEWYNVDLKEVLKYYTTMIY